jgi:hypothetical protein
MRGMNAYEVTGPAAPPTHVWHRCHGCGAQPIIGCRYECRTCAAGPDNDLCGPCYRRFQEGEIPHPSPTSVAACGAPRAHEFAAIDTAPAGAFDTWLGIPDREADPPDVPDLFVLRPEFTSGTDGYLGSYAFAATDPESGEPQLLTALHVLDELAKSKRVDTSARNAQYTGGELPRLVDGVRLYDVFAPNWMAAEVGVVPRMLTLPGARTGDDEPYSQRDIAVFAGHLPRACCPARLAPAAPRVGDPVWLVTAIRGRPERTVAAVVVESTADTLIYRFAPGTPERVLRFTSGSPLLDSLGQVVGINIGGGALGGRRLGHANHAGSIRQHLASHVRQTSHAHAHSPHPGR